MDEEQLRALVRESIQRHLGHTNATLAISPFASMSLHPSHERYAVLSGAEADGPCLIEPTVSCNHCGYCQSHGH